MDIVFLTRRGKNQYPHPSSAASYRNTPSQRSCLSLQPLQIVDSIQTPSTVARRSNRILTSAAARLLLQAARARNQELRNQVKDSSSTSPATTAPFHMARQTPRAELVPQVLQTNQPETQFAVAPPVLSAFQRLDESNRHQVSSLMIQSKGDFMQAPEYNGVASVLPARPTSTISVPLDEAWWRGRPE